MPGQAITSTTQDFLDIYDITNNFVVMKDGSVSAVLSVYAMNFSLLAEEEQDAVIYAYAALLNSLNYPIQINIQSKTKDATKYLELLRKQQEKASTREKAARIGRYQEFVGQLIQERNVLDKKFYVIIPANPVEMGIMAPQSFLPDVTGKNAFDISTIERSVILEKAANVLDPRVTHLIGQFNRIGLYATQLPTQEIIQNFYANYNPESTEGQQLVDSSDYATPLVRASVFNAGIRSVNQAESPATSSTEQQFSAPTTSLPDSPIVTATEQDLTLTQPPQTGSQLVVSSSEVQQVPQEAAPAQTAPITQSPVVAQTTPTNQNSTNQTYDLPPVAEIS